MVWSNLFRGAQAGEELQNANIIETKVSVQQTQVEISYVG